MKLRKGIRAVIATQEKYMQISLAIDKTYDNYDFSEIRCIEKPFAIILDSYMVGYGNLFYLALKFSQSYLIKKYNAQSTFEDIYKLQIKILKDFFCLDFNLENVEEKEIIDWTKTKIGQNCIPLIFGNLRELYYSKYYQKEDWGHVFLITGYDEKRELLNIYDSSQKYKEEHLAKYGSYVMTNEILQKMYHSRERLSNIKPGYIKVKQLTDMPDQEIVINAIMTDIKSSIIDKYREIEMLELIETEKDKSKQELMINDLMRVRNAKRMFLNFFCEYNEKNSDLKKIADELICEWQKLINNALIMIYRNQKIDFKQIEGHISKFERKFQKWCREEFDNDNTSLKIISKKKDDEEIRNNDDGIISKKGNVAEFSFSNLSKVYPDFGSDNAPKIIIKKKGTGIEKYLIKASVEVNKSDEFSEFLAGIYVKTITGDIYYWGNCCNQTIRFDLCGINNNIFETHADLKKQVIYIKLEGEKQLYLGINNDNNKLCWIYNTVLENKLVEIGIACKTWGMTKLLDLNIELFQNNE